MPHTTRRSINTNSSHSSSSTILRPILPPPRQASKAPTSPMCLLRTRARVSIEILLCTIAMRIRPIIKLPRQHSPRPSNFRHLHRSTHQVTLPISTNRNTILHTRYHLRCQAGSRRTTLNLQLPRPMRLLQHRGDTHIRLPFHQTGNPTLP